MYAENGLSEGVKVETALASYSFPTEKVNIDSYVRQYLAIDNKDLIDDMVEYERAVDQIISIADSGIFG